MKKDRLFSMKRKTDRAGTSHSFNGVPYPHLGPLLEGEGNSVAARRLHLDALISTAKQPWGSPPRGRVHLSGSRKGVRHPLRRIAGKGVEQAESG